ncbi:MAG: hypothetical protein A2X59_12100 [Nitrospirae bacterium GWC2_42_7]|nr:MAG: hypothetical protein A2X59_12100 [Nitrospirae bacterium GWC2_42_7]
MSHLVKYRTPVCHPGLSGILLTERFPTRGNDKLCGSTYELINNMRSNQFPNFSGTFLIALLSKELRPVKKTKEALK